MCPPNRFQNVNVAAEIAITPYVKRPATCNCKKKTKVSRENIQSMQIDIEM